MTKLYHILISQYFKTSPRTELFAVLERLLPIKFILDEQCEINTEGEIVSDGRINKDASITSASLNLPLPADPENKPHKLDTEVKFMDDLDVPFPFRGRKVRTKLEQIETVLLVKNDEKVLATCKWGPIWLVSETDGVKYFRSVLPLPTISSEQNFNDVFNGQCFLEMLILLQFVREISTNTAYQNAPLRASFIIDDPNLHWLRYGFVDYRKIIAHAQKENYHVSFATIPLDTWYTHRATADLFRKNSKWLSLLIHGNNHAKEELALNYPDKMRKALLEQAIKRIKRLEKKANIRVCRVMVPPHGACSDKMLSALTKGGFESACISAGSLRAYNQDKPWIKTLGFFPSEIIENCPVLPRWGLTGDVENTLLVAAYLGQPLILRGHHQDLKNEAEILNKYARFINGLGDVFWSNMTDLSRLNYLWRNEGTTCHVKPLGSKIAFKLPNEVNEVIIENPGKIDDCTWQEVSIDGFVRKIMPGERFLLSDEMAREIFIERNAILSQHASVAVDFRSTSAALILRRFLTEARDRLLL